MSNEYVRTYVHVTFVFIEGAVMIQTYPGSVGDEFENALKGETHGEGEVHVAQDVSEK